MSLVSGLLRKLLMTNRPSVILNEVKNRIVTKGKPTAEILHFVQNDKPREHPPAPFKGGTFFRHFSPV